MGTLVDYKGAAGGNFFWDGIVLYLDCGGGYITVYI